MERNFGDEVRGRSQEKKNFLELEISRLKEYILRILVFEFYASFFLVLVVDHVYFKTMDTRWYLFSTVANLVILAKRGLSPKTMTFLAILKFSSINVYYKFEVSYMRYIILVLFSRFSIFFDVDKRFLRITFVIIIFQLVIQELMTDIVGGYSTLYFFIFIWVYFQCFFDSLLMFYFHEKQTRYLVTTEKKIQSKNEERVRFIKLLSHTFRNNIGCILPSLKQIKKYILKKYGRNEEFEKRRFCELAMINCHHISRKVDNITCITNFEERQNETENPTLGLTSEKASRTKNYFRKLFKQLRVRSFLQKEVKLYFSKRSYQRIPRTWKFDKVVITRLIKNVLWGVLGKCSSGGKIATLVSFNDETKSIEFKFCEFQGDPSKVKYSFNTERYELYTPLESDLSLNMAEKVSTSYGCTAKFWEGQEGWAATFSVPFPGLPSKEEERRILTTSTFNLKSKEEEEEEELVIDREGDRDMLPLYILVVEDIEPLRNFLEMFIQKIGEKLDIPIICIGCENGKEAFDRVSNDCTFTPDVIFTDYNMPVMNGDRFSREVHERKLIPEWCDTYLVSGGNFTSEDFLKKNYFSEIISKPITKDQVEDRIRQSYHKKKRLFSKKASNNERKETKEPQQKQPSRKMSSMKSRFRDFSKDARKALLENRKNRTMCIVLLIGGTATTIFHPSLSYVWSFIILYYVLMITPAFARSFLSVDNIPSFVTEFLGRLIVTFTLFPAARIIFPCQYYDILNYKKWKKHSVTICTIFLCFLVSIELCFIYLWSETYTNSPKFIQSLIEIALCSYIYQFVVKYGEEKDKNRVMIETNILRIQSVTRKLMHIIYLSSESVRDEFHFLEFYSRQLFGVMMKENDDDRYIRTMFRQLFYYLSIMKKDHTNLSLLGSDISRPNNNNNKSLVLDVKKAVRDIIMEKKKYVSDYKNIEVELVTPKEEEMIYVSQEEDTKTLYVMINNLILNSYESILLSLKKNKNNNKKKIRIELRMTNNNNNDDDRSTISISVIDNGVGMKREEIERYNSSSLTHRRKFEIIAERGVRKGEEIGNPKLGIGLLCLHHQIVQEKIKNGRICFGSDQQHQQKEQKEEDDEENNSFRSTLLFDVLRKKGSSTTKRTKVGYHHDIKVFLRFDDYLFGESVLRMLMNIGIPRGDITISKNDSEDLSMRYDVAVLGPNISHSNNRRILERSQEIFVMKISKSKAGVGYYEARSERFMELRVPFCEYDL